MTNNHTKEPWEIVSIGGGENRPTEYSIAHIKPEIVLAGIVAADIDRIVAAVNFCEGYSNEKLAFRKSLKIWINQFAVQYDEMFQQREFYRNQIRWQAYDKNDRGTWPSKSGEADYETFYCIYDGKINTVFEAKWIGESFGEWSEMYSAHCENLDVTHYMKINPPKDKDDGITR